MNLIHSLFNQAICIIFACWMLYKIIFHINHDDAICMKEMNIKLPIFQIFLTLLNLYNCWVTWDPRIEIFEFLTPFAFSQLFVFLHLGSLCQVLTWHMYWKRMIELWEPFLTHATAHELLLVPMIGLQPLDLSPTKQWNNDYICQMQLLFVI